MELADKVPFPSMAVTGSVNLVLSSFDREKDMLLVLSAGLQIVRSSFQAIGFR